jgi:hypothetical protein
MKNLIGLFLLSLTTNVLAADSSWLLCKGKVNFEGSYFNIIINSLEHRAGFDDNGNQKRINDLTLIFGNRLITGSLDTTNDMNGSVALATTDNKSTFAGIVIFDYQTPNLVLKGKLVIDEELSSIISVETTCEYMN